MTTTIDTRPARTPDPAGPARPDQLDLLEAHAVFVIREVAARCERPVLLFDGGKDSAVLLRLAEKALHVDTGHNFGEVREVRDKRVADRGEELATSPRR